MKRQRKSNRGRKAEGGTASKVLDGIRNLSLDTDSRSAHLKLLDEVSWMVDRGLENRVLDLIEEDLPDESRSKIGFALRTAASRLIFNDAGSLSTAREVEETESLILIPFAIAINMSFVAGEASQFPTELPDAIDRVSELALAPRAFALPDDVTVFLDHRLYQPQSDEWLLPSATRRYLKSILAHLERPATPVIPLSSDYRRRQRSEELLPDDVDICQRLICGAIVRKLDLRIETPEEAGDLLFGERDDKSDPESGEFEELSRLFEDEMEERCRMTQFTVTASKTPIELYEVPRYAFQMQRTVSLGFATEKALEGLQEVDPEGELEITLYVSPHGTDEELQEFRLAAYLVNDEGIEEEMPFFCYAWEIAHELESPEDIDEGVSRVVARLNSSVNMVEGLQPDARCDNCGEKLFPGPGGKFYHEPDTLDESDDLDDSFPLFEN